MRRHPLLEALGKGDPGGVKISLEISAAVRGVVVGVDDEVMYLITTLSSSTNEVLEPSLLP